MKKKNYYKKKSSYEIITFIFLGLFLAFFMIWQYFPTLEPKQEIITPIVVQAKSQDIAPTPTFQISPDGNKKVIMKKNGFSFRFYTADAVDNGEEFLYATTSAEMKLPFNAWSPDNKYVFIEKNNMPLVFNKETKEYYDVQSVFGEKIIREATGWASPTLLIVNTNEHSYWFEVLSRAVIQLSSQF